MSALALHPARPILYDLYCAALAAVDGETAVRRQLSRRSGRLEIAGRELSPGSKLVVLAVGKAASRMAAALEAAAGDDIRCGLAVGPDANPAPGARIQWLTASHPLPDARSERAGRRLLELAAAADAGDTLLVLLSGGASSLAVVPAGELTLADLETATRALLASGADIAELNAVRKHLSLLGGGQLGRAAGCRRIELFAISDVPGDRLDVIGSGPCSPDPSTFADALDVLERRAILEEVSPRVALHLRAGAAGALAETPDADDPTFARIRARVVACNADARRAACQAARERGIDAIDLGEMLLGEARTLGRRLALDALERRAPAPSVAIAGGETTVRLRGAGRGGRSQELALAAAIAFEGHEGLALLAAGSDGIDGPTDAAGAYADAGTVARGDAAGVRARAALDDNDSHGFFEREGGLLRTGPTCTNVSDLVFVWRDGPKGRAQ